MSVTELHPEDLFDKLLEGDITSSERERLRAHLGACSVCRFEYAARGDFRDEAHTLSPLDTSSFPLRAPKPVVVRKRRSPLAVWALAAAALISASGAFAALGKAPWPPFASLFVGRAPEAAPSASAKAAAVVSPWHRPRVVSAAGSPTACASVGCPGVEAAPPAEVLAAPALPAPEALVQPVHPAAPVRKLRVPKPTPARNELAADEGAASSAGPARSAAAKLFSDANSARRAADWGRASGLYHLLQEQFPGSAEAELSRVTLATVLLGSGDAAGALSGFERYLAGPSRALEAEALVGRARALGRLGRRSQEASAWEEVKRKFPRSIYARQASERLATLRP